jgi:CheY-like chemotaxis protein
MAARPNPKTAPKRCRLLYVEDDSASLALVSELIAARKDLTLVHAADLDRGLQLARREAPDVMLVNVDLAALAPRELLKRLRSEPATQAAPLLATGADASPDSITKGLEAGWFLYLAKPLQAGLFMEALDFALEFAAVERAEQL